MTSLNYCDAKFIISVAELSQLPRDSGKEVAFIGRSNSGKSSTLNILTKQKKLAYVSKTPGRTQLINFFSITENVRLVDLPGYGYAKVSLNVKHRWQKLLADYLQARESLKGLVLLMDIRHPFQPLDRHIISWALEGNLPIHILLTKADKLNYGARKNALQKALKEVRNHYEKITIQIFSVPQKIGCEELEIKLNDWFK